MVSSCWCFEIVYHRRATLVYLVAMVKYPVSVFVFIYVFSLLISFGLCFRSFPSKWAPHITAPRAAAHSKPLQLSRFESTTNHPLCNPTPLIFSDEDEEEGDDFEEEVDSSSPAMGVDMSVIKEGIKPLLNINGSDVRVGIIMARWNADVILGLYKVRFGLAYVLPQRV